MSSSLFRKGSPTSSDPRKGLFVSIGDDESVALASLVQMSDMLSADVHEFWEINPFVTFPCLGADCPGCEVDNPTRFKAYLPIVTREGEVKIFAFGIRVANQLTDIEAAVGEIKGKILRIKRIGKGLKTQYTVVPTGNAIDVEDYDIPDIVGSFGDITLEGITKVMITRGLFPVDEKSAPALPKGEPEVEEPAAAAKTRKSKKADVWDGI